MRFPAFAFLTAALVALAAPAGHAQAQVVKKSVKKTAAGAQEIELDHAYHLTRDCAGEGPIRVALINPPRHGALQERATEVYPAFKQDSPRFACNQKKVPATAAFYKAKEGFRGVDKFVFALVFSDGEMWRYEAEVTVLAPLN